MRKTIRGEIVSTRQLARILGTSVKSVRDAASAGLIPVHKRGESGETNEFNTHDVIDARAQKRVEDEFKKRGPSKPLNEHRNAIYKAEAEMKLIELGKARGEI